MRVLIVAPPFAGHLNRLVTMAQAAREAGHDCAFVTGQAKLAALRARGFAAAAPPSIAPDAMERVAHGHGRTAGRPWRLVAQFRDNLRLLPHLAADLERHLREAPADVVVADSVAVIAGPVCERLGLPWITAIASPFAIENRRGTPAFLGGLTPRPGPLGAARDAGGRAAVRLFKRAVFAAHRRAIGPLLPAPYRADGSEAIYARRILGFGMRELEFDRDWPAGFEMIGPVHGALEESPALALPPGRAQVLATIGTHLPWAKDRLVRDVARLAARMPDLGFTVSLGNPGDPAPPRAPATNLRVVPFVPYHRDLGRFDAVIHHGGSGIVYAAIEAGVPSLVVPLDHDQPDFAARIAHHGLGLRLRALGPAADPALRRLLRGGEWPAVARFRRLAAAYRPSERFVAAIEEAVRAAAPPA